jgi:serine protease
MRRRASVVASLGFLGALVLPTPAFAAPDDGSPTFVEGPAAADAAEGEWIVDLKDDVTPTDVADVERLAGQRLVANSVFSAHEHWMRLALGGEQARAVVARLAGDPRVESIEANRPLWATFVPNDPLYAADQWHLSRIGAGSAWDRGCGRGVTVAVVDTGIACFDEGPFAKGSDLAGTRCVPGYNFVDDNDNAHDDHGHGTHVAGTIAQTTHNNTGAAGIAHCASLMPVKVLTSRGWGSLADVAEGIVFAADHGADVINLSLGGPSSAKVLEKAVQYATKKGSLVVAAAGNSGGAVGYPAAYADALAVSATGRNDKLAWFSSRGPEVDVAAPGVAITQQTVCNGGRDKCELFATWNGTSMASPHVAGTAAVLVGMGVTSPVALRERLAATARDAGPSDQVGAGIVDAARATQSVLWTRTVGRFLSLLALGAWVLRRIRRSREGVSLPLRALIAMAVGATGLFPFAPYLRVDALGDRLRLVTDVAMRPFGEWDILGSAHLHRFLLMGNALPVLALVAVGFGSRTLRPIAGGFALGMAAYLGHLAWAGDMTFILGTFGLRVFAVLNAVVCVWVARVALAAPRTR